MVFLRTGFGKFRYALAVIVTVACVGLATAFMLTSHAATPTASIEAENGTVSSAANTIGDTSASGGQAVKFGDGSGSGTWPDASNTGVPAGTDLQVVDGVASGTGWISDSSGRVTITASGAVLNDLDIKGSVYNPNGYKVNITNTMVRCIGEDIWCVELGAGGSSFIDSTILPGTQDGVDYTYAGGIYTGPDSGTNIIKRANISHTTSCIRLNGNTQVLDSYFHDQPMGDDVYRAGTGEIVSGVHSSDMFISSGQNDLVSGNEFEQGNSAEIFMQDYDDDATGVGNITITGNRFLEVSKNGENSSYGLGLENKDVKGPITITNNVFSKTGWSVGPAEIPEQATTYSGNTYLDGSSADGDFIARPVVY